MKCAELSDVKNWNEERRVYSFPCAECGALVEGPRIFHKGDPRNFAIMAHWDGFQSARTRQRDCWTPEVTILNCGKRIPFGPFPILFIPVSSAKLIKEGNSNILTSFLEPFISEVEKLFAERFQTLYAYPAEMISDNLAVHDLCQPISIRAILMLFTGDHPAQCKAGALKSGGFLACRRHNLLSCYQNATVPVKKSLYEDTRKEVRFCPPRRTVQSLFESVMEWRELSEGTERTQVARYGGISGYSIFWRMYHLNGFDLSLDLVYDVMHVLALCVFKNYVHLLVNTMKQLGREDELEDALITISKPTCRPVGLGCRWPNMLSSLPFFKAEEYTNFILWCLPHILDKLRLQRSTVLGGLGVLLIEIGRLFYVHARRYGWSEEMITIAKMLLHAWRVWSEESLGPNNSPLEHVAGSGELFDDVSRHGCHDIFWCYGFEREVSTYKRITTNHRQNEVSYTLYFERICFTRAFTAIQPDYDGLVPSTRALLLIHKHLQLPKEVYRPLVTNGVCCEHWHQNCVLIVQSQDMARELSKLIHHVQSCECVQMLERKGMLVAARRRRRETHIVRMDAPTRFYLLQYWRDKGLLIDDTEQFFREDISYVRFVLLDGREYRVGSLVVVKPDVESDNTLNYWVWKAKVLNFFIHEFEGIQEVFFTVKYFAQRVESEISTVPLLHDVTDMQILSLRPSEVCVRPVHQLMYQFIPMPMHPTSDGRKFVHAYELEDVRPREHLLRTGEPGCCPPYPVVGDVMMMHAEGGEPFLYAVVRRVNAKAIMDMEVETNVGTVEERDDLVGTVDVCYLQRHGPRSSKYVADVDETMRCSWHKLVKLTMNFRPTRFLGSTPIEWRDMANRTS